ncbi:hypothetical protein LNP25_21550 [Klebsiella variicola subsp. variicola]|nr:hypothetical protein [Klebsiella variicola subsp. variicola]
MLALAAQLYGAPTASIGLPGWRFQAQPGMKRAGAENVTSMSARLAGDQRDSVALLAKPAAVHCPGRRAGINLDTGTVAKQLGDIQRKAITDHRPLWRWAATASTVCLASRNQRRAGGMRAATADPGAADLGAGRFDPGASPGR